jgi:hypothetical protein
LYRNVTEFEDRWNQPVNTNQIAEMNTYVNPTETQRRLDIFSQVKAATLLPAVDASLTDSDEEQVKEDLTEVSILSFCIIKNSSLNI